MTAFLLGILCARAVSAQAPSFNWEIVGQTGGPTQALAMGGDYAYVGVGLNLRVVDLSDPVAPRQAGASSPFTHAVEAVAVNGTTAFVAVGPAGLATIDISDPSRPRLLGGLDTKGFACGVVVVDSRAYVADGPRGLLIVDVSNAASPTVVGSTDASQYVTDVVVRGTKAYLAAGTAGLLVADVSDPTHPRITATFDTPGFAYSLDSVGGTVYLADGWEGVRIIDAAGEQPVQTGRLQTAGWAFGIAVSGSRAYVADAFRGMAIVDIANPASPREVTRWELKGTQAARVVLSGGRAIIADRNLGLLVVDTAPAIPVLLGAHRPIGVAVGLAVEGNYAYVANGNAGLGIVDVSNPDAPVEVSTIDTRGYFAEQVAVAGKVVYATVRNTDRGDQVQIFDVSDPIRPRRVGAYSSLDHVREAGNSYRDVVAGGSTVYVPTEGGLEVIDASNPASPATAGYTDLPVFAEPFSVTVAMALRDQRAFVVAGFNGVFVMDVSDPAKLTTLSVFKPGAYADAVAAAPGSRIYVTDHSGLHVADAADPCCVTELGFLATPEPSNSVSVIEPVAFLANNGNVLVVDVSMPSRPTLRQTISINGLAQEVFTDGRLLYVAAGTGGLMIFRPSASDRTATVEPESSIQPPRFPAQRSVPYGPRRDSMAKAARVDRTAAGDCVVSSAADSGSGSLRACLEAPPGATISFDPATFPPDQPATIRLSSAFSPIRQGNITIDASDAGVILDGSLLTTGLGFWLQSPGNVIRGMQILNFPGSSISVASSNNTIGGDRSIGRGPTGQGNVLSGSKGIAALTVCCDTANGNRIEGNLVGVDVTGGKALPNRQIGIYLTLGASQNIVSGNIVSGNGNNGINLGFGSRDNFVSGNSVGTDITGSVAIANGASGIVVETSSLGNTIRDNLVSGNAVHGIVLSDPGTGFNSILDNRIGTDVTGTKAIPNKLCAAINGLGATFNRFDGNLVSGNHQGFCFLGGQGATGVLVMGNRIGADITGTHPLGNELEGAILGGTPRMIVEGNIVVANGGAGIRLAGDGVYVSGNLIGTDGAGGAGLDNGGPGILIAGTRDNYIQSNRIANNAGAGVLVNAPGVGNTIRRNAIHDNQRGITIASGANATAPAPVLTLAGITSVSGTACAGCEVEIYSDSAAQGRLLEGSTIAAANGVFTLNKQARFAGPQLTALATDARGNTSEFSMPLPTGITAGPLSVASAASTKGGAQAAASIVSAFGARLATRLESAVSTPLPTTLGGTMVEVRDHTGTVLAAPLLFVSPGQVNFILPEGAALGPAAVTITASDGSVSITALDVVAVAPGLFSASATGQGLAAALVQRAGSSSVEYVARYDLQGRPVAIPIDLGPGNDPVYLILFGTGIRNRGSLATVSVGGVPAAVLYAGAQPEYPGLDQVNVVIPPSLRGRGLVMVELIVGGLLANPVSIEVK